MNQGRDTETSVTRGTHRYGYYYGVKSKSLEVSRESWLEGPHLTSRIVQAIELYLAASVWSLGTWIKLSHRIIHSSAKIQQGTGQDRCCPQ